MAIPVKCPACQAEGELPNQAAGSEATCPVCRTAFPVPVPPPPAEVADGFAVWVDSVAVAPPTPLAQTPPPVISAEAAKPVGGTGPDWVRDEAEQFKTYVANQLSRLENLRRQVADAESRYEALCVTRSMDLNRHAAALDARAADLDRREADLRQVTDSIAARQAEVDRLAGALSEREAAVAERESHRTKLETEAAELARLVAELRPAVERLELRKTEAEGIRAELASKQKNLDRRLIEVGRTELAIQKRIAELDETERTLQQELEEREAELERQRAVFAEEMKASRSRVPIDAQTPMPRSLEKFGSKTPVKDMMGLWAESVQSGR